MTDSNADLVTGSPAPVVQPEPVGEVEQLPETPSAAPATHTLQPPTPVAAPDVSPVITPVVAEKPAPITETQAYKQHVASGYRPVGGAEIARYVRAKEMGLEGRPSKAEVDAFLADKG